MDDKRGSPRFQVNLYSQLKEYRRNFTAPCKIEDLNYRGIRIATENSLDITQESSSLGLSLAPGFFISFEAKLAWSRNTNGYTYAFAFTKISEADKAEIYSFIHKCLPDQLRKHTWNNIS
jgi:hypothetical protein